MGDGSKSTRGKNNCNDAVKIGEFEDNAELES
jgi:hypothetical protein